MLMFKDYKRDQFFYGSIKLLKKLTFAFAIVFGGFNHIG